MVSAIGIYLSNWYQTQIDWHQLYNHAYVSDTNSTSKDIVNKGVQWNTKHFTAREKQWIDIQDIKFSWLWWLQDVEYVIISIISYNIPIMWLIAFVKELETRTAEYLQ